MKNDKNREFVRTLHSMIADFLRDNPDIDRSYYQEIWDWLEKKEDEENDDERIRKELVNFLQSPFREENLTDEKVAPWLAYLEKQKEPRPIINFPVFIEEKNIEQVIKKFLSESAKFQKKQTFTHHEIDESLQDAVTHQMEDDGDVDDFVRRGIDDIVLKYAEIGAKWQKEQKPADLLDELKHYLATTPKEQIRKDREEIERWYKEHMVQTQDECSIEEKPTEWSEEDKKTISFTIDVLRANHPDGFFKTTAAGDIHVTGITTEDLVKKLQSLLSRPKPSSNWKPTKEQLGALLEAAREKEIDREDGNVLYQLYDQLKKL